MRRGSQLLVLGFLLAGLSAGATAALLKMAWQMQPMPANGIAFGISVVVFVIYCFAVTNAGH